MLNGIRKILVDDTTLQGLVGSKVYSVRASQKADPPLIVLLVAGVDPNNCKDDAGGRLDEVSLSVSIMTTKYAQGNTIYERVRSLLDNYSGVSDGEDLDIDFVTYQDNYDDKAKLHVKNLTFEVMHKETV